MILYFDIVKKKKMIKEVASTRHALQLDACDATYKWRLVFNS